MAYTGECFCGSVKYRLTEAPHSARSCHCSRCRKVFSAQASAYAVVDPNTFTWTEGAHLLTAYVGKQNCGVLFCSTCGSTMCGTMNGVIHGITLGCLNEDPPLKLEPHIFVGSKAAWEKIPENVEQYESYPDDWKSPADD